MQQKAKWWIKETSGRIKCTLCPRYCILANGQKGFCYIRENIDGILYSIGYGRPTGFAIDPIEKKPLNHFYPGSEILSFGTAGCNLGCKFCQNWTMSKAKLDEVNSVSATPEDVVALAKKHNLKLIAYTYNDPTIIGEYVIDISRLALRLYSLNKGSNNLACAPRSLIHDSRTLLQPIQPISFLFFFCP